MKPKPLEIERLRREVARLRAERDILKRPQPASRGKRYEVRFHREAPEHLASLCWQNWAWLCEALDVSRSGFHAWLTRSPSPRTRDDEVVGAKVHASFRASDRSYGARRVWRDVLADGVSCGLHRIERLMRSQALRARPRRRGLAFRHLRCCAEEDLRPAHIPTPNRGYWAKKEPGRLTRQVTLPARPPGMDDEVDVGGGNRWHRNWSREKLLAPISLASQFEGTFETVRLFHFATVL